jgi:hypothetical protein
MEIFNYSCLVTSAFGQPRHIAPSLRLFVPNGLMEYNNPSFLMCLWSSPRGGYSPAAPAVFQWFNPDSGCSPAVPTAPSLRPVISSGSLMRCNPFPCTNPFLFVCLFVCFLILEGPMLQFFWSLGCQHILLALGRWPDLPKCVLINFSYCDK